MLLDSLVYTYIVDRLRTEFRREHSSSCARPSGIRQGGSVAGFFYVSQLSRSSTKQELLLLSKNAVYTLHFKAVKSCSPRLSLLNF